MIIPQSTIYASADASAAASSDSSISLNDLSVPTPDKISTWDFITKLTDDRITIDEITEMIGPAASLTMCPRQEDIQTVSSIALENGNLNILPPLVGQPLRTADSLIKETDINVVLRYPVYFSIYMSCSFSPSLSAYGSGVSYQFIPYFGGQMYSPTYSNRINATGQRVTFTAWYSTPTAWITSLHFGIRCATIGGWSSGILSGGYSIIPYNGAEMYTGRFNASMGGTATQNPTVSIPKELIGEILPSSLSPNSAENPISFNITLNWEEVA